jgi:hypothetical protein
MCLHIQNLMDQVLTFVVCTLGISGVKLTAPTACGTQKLIKILVPY